MSLFLYPFNFFISCTFYKPFITVMSGARAGRGSVELVLPDVSTVSREHARFTFSDGRWWVANQGRNGLCLNGAPVAGERPVADGDSIRWGSRPDALLSRVEIGR